MVSLECPDSDPVALVTWWSQRWIPSWGQPAYKREWWMDGGPNGAQCFASSFGPEGHSNSSERLESPSVRWTWDTQAGFRGCGSRNLGTSCREDISGSPPHRATPSSGCGVVLGSPYSPVSGFWRRNRHLTGDTVTQEYALRIFSNCRPSMRHFIDAEWISVDSDLSTNS